MIGDRPRVLDLPAEVWSEQAGLPLELTRDWLSALEESDPTPVRYLVDGTAAALPVLLSERSQGSLSVYSEYLSRIPGDWARFRPGPSLLVGARAGYTNRVWIGDLGADGIGRIKQALLELGRQAPKQPQAVAALSCDRKGTRRALALLGEDSLVFVSRPETVLYPSEFPDGDYVESLPSRRRRTVRRERQRLQDQGFQLTECRLSGHVDVFARLTANLIAKHGGSATRDSLERHFRALAERANDRAVGFLLMLAGRPAASSLLLKQAGTFVAKNVGIDTSVVRRRAEVFSTGYYSSAEYAAAAGAARLYGGIGTYEAKLLRGFQLEPRWSVVRLSSTGGQRRLLHNAVGKSNSVRAYHYATMSRRHVPAGQGAPRASTMRDFIYRSPTDEQDACP